MELNKLLRNTPLKETVGSTAQEISALEFDSRKVSFGSLYVALSGTLSDGHNYIDAAISKGATAVVCEQLPQSLLEQVCYLVVEDAHKTLGLLASAFYGHPSTKLTLVGVTGTNGKTSVATLLHDTFTKLGKKCILLSTVENRIGSEKEPATHTTPDVVTINKILAKGLSEGCEYAFMEVSSHGIVQQRISGLTFKLGAFTNISHDHLDYHETFAKYLKAKKAFFDSLGPQSIAVTNLDDRNGNVMLQNTAAKKVGYATKSVAPYQGRLIETGFEGMHLRFNGTDFWTGLSGDFNVSNLLLVFAVASELGFEKQEILSVLSTLERVKGRFETFKSDSGIYFIIDYAHTPDALANVLDTINAIRTKNERLICVFGCGGDRDKAKRPEMGRIATQKATLSILTSDNPRTEDPSAIIKDIASGVLPNDFNKYTEISDREQAIKMAIKFAEPKDIVLVAGKGHETYQEIGSERLEFDDRKKIMELLYIMGK